MDARVMKLMHKYCIDRADARALVLAGFDAPRKIKADKTAVAKLNLSEDTRRKLEV